MLFYDPSILSDSDPEDQELIQEYVLDALVRLLDYEVWTVLMLS